MTKISINQFNSQKIFNSSFTSRRARQQSSLTIARWKAEMHILHRTRHHEVGPSTAFCGIMEHFAPNANFSPQFCGARTFHKYNPTTPVSRGRVGNQKTKANHLPKLPKFATLQNIFSRL